MSVYPGPPLGRSRAAVARLNEEARAKAATDKPNLSKPLGRKAYGSIPHLPCSRRGPGDHGLSDEQASILTEKTRDKDDFIVVQEKLDGSCVAVAKIGGVILPLIRAGYLAWQSHYRQHHIFSAWVLKNQERFNELLKEGERAIGEWLIQAHGTRYNLPHEPFVLFDIMRGQERAIAEEVSFRCGLFCFNFPSVFHAKNEPFSVAQLQTIMGESWTSLHGAVGGAEGAVWRCERAGRVDFLGKYVRNDKVDGLFLESKTGKGPVWNVVPETLV